MRDVAIFIKSYAKDFHLLYRCLASLERNNPEAIPVLVSVPDADVGLATELLADFANLTLFEDSFWRSVTVDGRDGYINQQIIKLNVDLIGEFGAYFIVDSDTIFIREVKRSDLMLKDGRVKLLADDGELARQPFYRGYALKRRSSLELIRTTLGLTDESEWLESHNSLVFDSNTLARLRQEIHSSSFGVKSYAELTNLAPYEFNWYVSYVLRERLAGHKVCPPVVKMWHTGEHYWLDVVSGWTLKDLQQSYVGVIPNSSWASHSLAKRLVDTLSAVVSTVLRVISRDGLLLAGKRLRRPEPRKALTREARAKLQQGRRKALPRRWT